MSRPSGRRNDELRAISITRHYTRHAEGSVLIRCGDTHVLCTASVEETVPPFLRNRKRGWVTAEYGMLARATTTRNRRDGRSADGRAVEISRLIGRAMRAAVDMRVLGERSIMIDCDVIQADGGTRAAAISGAYVALVDAAAWLLRHELVPEDPIRRALAGISVGVLNGEVVTDMNYAEDRRADTDLNVVMDDQGALIEIQGSAEAAPFDVDTLQRMLVHARGGIDHILSVQRDALAADRDA